MGDAGDSSTVTSDARPLHSPHGENVGKMRRVLVLAVAFGLFGCQPAAPARSDADLTAVMLSNVAELDTANTWYPLLLTDGTHLDLGVKNGVLIVATLLSQTDTADAAIICSNIAAETNDPDTAKPLGISGVVIISGGKQIADCAP
jgi:hypothetical protein